MSSSRQSGSRTQTRQRSTPKAEATRCRIVETARTLFNEQGAAAVSTNHIAAALSMSPGTLYYHFSSKDGIYTEILVEFASAVDVALPLLPPEELNPAVLEGYFRACYKLMWRYRCVLEATSEFLRTPDRAEIMRQFQNAAIERMTELCIRLKAAGVMTGPATTPEVIQIAELLWIVFSNWPRFVTLQSGRVHPTPADLAAGFERQYALMRPYIAPGITLAIHGLAKEVASA